MAEINWFMKKSFLISIVIVSIIITYLLFNPIYYSGLMVFIAPKYLKNLEDSRNYFSSFQSIVTIIASILGLVLGYFYYANRKTIDRKIIVENRRKYFFEKLFSEINKYDQAILSILSDYNIGLSDLIRNRIIIEQVWDIIESMIEPTVALLEFNDEEISTFLRINSFVEQTDIIMSLMPNAYTAVDLNQIKRPYLELIKEVRLLCLKKIS